MILHTLDRMRRCRGAHDLVLATSTEASDDRLAATVAAHGVKVFRGSLEDVAGRLLAAARTCTADAMVRISGDSPFVDPGVVDTMIDVYRSATPDLATNVLVRTFPKGISVEVISSQTLSDAHPHMDEDWREHVTTGFYRAPHRYRIAAITSGVDAGSIQLSVDTPEDFARAERIVSALGPQTLAAGWRDIAAIHASQIGCAP